MSVPLWCWFAAGALIAALLAVDFAVHRGVRQISLRYAIAVSAGWIGVGVLFGLVLGATRGWDSASEYFAGYLIEKSLSIDNIFVFALLFGSFGVSPTHQRRVLFYGVFGALVLRGVFITAGASILDHFSWALYVLGALLLLSAGRMVRGTGLVDPERNIVIKSLRRVLPVTPTYVGARFFGRHDGRLMATPLLVALIAIEVTDLVFAMDSIPAIFGVTRDVFVVFTANAFAVLGLRALYFVLAGALHRFAYIKYGVAALLIFVGLKMLLAWLVVIPILASLIAIVVIIGISIAISVWHEPRKAVVPAGASRT